MDLIRESLRRPLQSVPLLFPRDGDVHFGRNRTVRAIKDYRVDHQGNLWTKVCQIRNDEHVLLTARLSREDEVAVLDGFVVAQL